MAFAEVHHSLQGLFPEVDNRILKAVAIEHSKDLNKAIDVILFEILPSLSKMAISPVPVSPRENQGLVLRTNRKVAHEKLQPDMKLKLKEVVEDSDVGPSSMSSFIVKENGDDDLHASTFMNACSSSLDKDNLESSLISHQSDKNTLHVNNDAELMTPLSNNSNIDFEPNFTSNGTLSSSLQVSVASECESSSTVLKRWEAFEWPSTNINDQNTDKEELYYGSTMMDVGDSVMVLSSAKKDEETFGFYKESSLDEEQTHESEDDFNIVVANCEEPETSCPVDHAFIEDNSDCEMHDALNNSVSRSDQICSHEFLEEIIEDAKSNKKILFSSMESVINMMREVEIEEKNIEETKEEAAKAGLDTLSKTEELTKMLKHAKELNDMHAGEVYGEKSILAVEVKELQNRLLCLADERDKSLAILDEMRKTLEVRLTEAEKERKAVEQEKLVKEESAQRALAEQKSIMEKVVQQSDILQRDADENSTLREFLMDRGRIVDTLQGEISVLCQDVKLLKERFDEGVPLSKSLSSSRMLASSTSSTKSMTSVHVREQYESTESPKKSLSPSSSIHSQSQNCNPAENTSQLVEPNHDALLNWEWDLVDDNDDDA